MSRSEVYNLKVSKEERQKLTYYAASKELTPAEVLRDFIKSLPDPKPS